MLTWFSSGLSSPVSLLYVKSSHIYNVFFTDEQSYWITYGVTFISADKGDVQWRVPVGFQLVPVGLMMFVIPFMKESPRWLATKHRNDEALKSLAWIRKTPMDDPDTLAEYNEIVASVEEEEAVVGGRTWREAFAPGNRIRFFIAFIIFTAQQWHVHSPTVSPCDTS